jgi:plasmid stabilization system protein ParE
MVWEIFVTDLAEQDRDGLFLSLGQRRGADYARRWLDGLVDTTNALAGFPGPRSCPLSYSESERRRAEVRTCLYPGPNRQNPPSVACKVIFAVYDPTQLEETGQIRILRYLKAQGQDAQALDVPTPLSD